MGGDTHNLLAVIWMMIYADEQISVRVWHRVEWAINRHVFEPYNQL